MLWTRIRATRRARATAALAALPCLEELAVCGFHRLASSDDAVLAAGEAALVRVLARHTGSLRRVLLLGWTLRTAGRVVWLQPSISSLI